MSVAVCRGPVVPAFEAPCWLKPYKPEPVADHRPPAPARVDVWNVIQADVDKAAGAKKVATCPANKPYVHPMVRRSSGLMSQKSLEVCTESLGNETGSVDFTTSLDCLFDSPLPAVTAAEESFWEQNNAARDCDFEECEMGNALAAVNYHHCSAGTRRRAFPPPLPSMSRRDGPCLQLRQRREGGRLVVEAVAVRPRGYLHARRQDGRLHLAFVECSTREQQSPDTESKITTATDEAPYFPALDDAKNEQEEDAAVEMIDDDDEEEVEVVDRGTVVEVKVSTQPQTPTAGGKVHRSRLVINKFVGNTPLTADHPQNHNDVAHFEAACNESPPPKLRRVPSSTTTLAAAVAAASTGTDEEDDDEFSGLQVSASSAAPEPKQLLLLTSRRGDKQDLLQSVRRCRQLRQNPLFILEPYCIATS
jgi:hypothetical protein